MHLGWVRTSFAIFGWLFSFLPSPREVEDFMDDNPVIEFLAIRSGENGYDE